MDNGQWTMGKRRQQQHQSNSSNKATPSSSSKRPKYASIHPVKFSGSSVDCIECADSDGKDEKNIIENASGLDLSLSSLTKTTSANAGTCTSLSSPPYRDVSDLYTCTETYHCAINYKNMYRRPCIPCAYKIGLFDVVKDTKFSSVVRNVRPEECPRAKVKINYPTSTSKTPKFSKKFNGHKRRQESDHTTCTLNNSHYYGNAYGYRPGMKILTVGDGDFSFSLAISRILFPKKEEILDRSIQTHQEKSVLIATSYESKEKLVSVYPNIQATIDELESIKDVHVYFNVDATRLDETLPYLWTSDNSDVASQIPQQTIQFDRVIWNFPCTAIANGQDGQRAEMMENQLLIQQFVFNLIHHGLLVEQNKYKNNSINGAQQTVGGEIHMLHKTKPRFEQWKIQEMALTGWKKDDSNNDGVNNDGPPCPLEYKGRITLDKSMLKPYTPRKALDKKSFSCHDACMYIFGWSSKPSNQRSTNSSTSMNQTHRLHYLDRTKQQSPSSSNELQTLFSPTILSSCDTNSNTSKNHTQTILPVNQSMIDDIRQIHLSYQK